MSMTLISGVRIARYHNGAGWCSWLFEKMTVTVTQMSPGSQHKLRNHMPHCTAFGGDRRLTQHASWDLNLPNQLFAMVCWLQINAATP